MMAVRASETGTNTWEKSKDKYVEISQIVRADLRGWAVCLAVLVITVVRSGITYSFGMFVVELEKEFPEMSMAEQSKRRSHYHRTDYRSLQLRFDCSSTALRPFDDIRHDRAAALRPK